VVQVVLCRDALVHPDECLQVMGCQDGCLVASPDPDLLNAVQECQLSIRCVVLAWQFRSLFAVVGLPFRSHQTLKQVQWYQGLPRVEQV